MIDCQGRVALLLFADRRVFASRQGAAEQAERRRRAVGSAGDLLARQRALLRDHGAAIVGWRAVE